MPIMPIFSALGIIYLLGADQSVMFIVFFHVHFNVYVIGVLCA